LCAHPRCLATTGDELFVRACAGTVLRTTFGLLLSEAGQATAVRDLAMLVKRGVAELGAASPTVAACRSTLVVALTELGHLIAELDGSAAAILPVCVEAATAASAHPAFGVRQAAAWVFRCLAMSSGISLHSLLTTLLANVARTSAEAHALAPPDVVARFKVCNAEAMCTFLPAECFSARIFAHSFVSRSLAGCGRGTGGGASVHAAAVDSSGPERGNARVVGRDELCDVATAGRRRRRC